MIETQEYNVVILHSFTTNQFRIVENWDITEALEHIQDSDRYYGFRFERRRRTLNKDIDNGRFDVKVETLEQSDMYYINCYVETEEDLQVQPAKNNFILQQMNNLGITKIVKTIRKDLTFPFKNGDVLLDNRGHILDY